MMVIYLTLKYCVIGTECGGKFKWPIIAIGQIVSHNAIHFDNYELSSSLSIGRIMGATKYLERNMSDKKSTRGMNQIYTLSAYYYDF